MGKTINNYDWYFENIEEPIREIVKRLRNVGINTFCSCGHEMTIQCEYYDNGELNWIYNILIELNIKNYRVEITNDITNGYRNSWIDIMLPDKNGNYSYIRKLNEDFNRKEAFQEIK